MIEIVILGSGAGFATRDRFCTSIALLADRDLYLFDCGEPCAALLFRAGIDALALKTVFVSHMHPDHVGGLASLLFSVYLPARRGGAKFRPWSVDRNDPWYRAAMRFPAVSSQASEAAGPQRVRLMLPGEGIGPIRSYLTAVYLPPSILPFDLSIEPIRPGPFYEDGVVQVAAVPNAHLTGNPAYRNLPTEYEHMALESYSFRIQVGPCKIVYSGDVASLDEMRPLVDDADLLIVEVAHVDPFDIGRFVRDLKVPRVVLTHIHPGLESGLAELVEGWADGRIEVAHDGMSILLASAPRTTEFAS